MKQTIYDFLVLAPLYMWLVIACAIAGVFEIMYNIWCTMVELLMYQDWDAVKRAWAQSPKTWKVVFEKIDELF